MKRSLFRASDETRRKNHSPGRSPGVCGCCNICMDANGCDGRSPLSMMLVTMCFLFCFTYRSCVIRLRCCICSLFTLITFFCRCGVEALRRKWRFFPIIFDDAEVRALIHEYVEVFLQELQFMYDYSVAHGCVEVLLPRAFMFMRNGMFVCFISSKCISIHFRLTTRLTLCLYIRAPTTLTLHAL